MNELIQFVRLFILIFINIDNFKNKLTSHISQLSTSLLFSFIYTL